MYAFNERYAWRLRDNIYSQVVNENKASFLRPTLPTENMLNLMYGKFVC